MLEEQTMEKKGSSRTSSSGKGNSSECKVKQEVPGRHSRSFKKRDNVPVRPEPPRRPFPQRCKTAYDKRPQPRGGFHPDNDRSEVAKALQDEAASALKRGSKKVNLNHLLNFTIAPRGATDSIHGVQQQQKCGKNRHKLPKYNKELFLQANCQFTVREEGDYSVHCVNPDILVDWATVEEIQIPSYEVPSCPICLYPPIAAKITRCGHIYCWACILHYLALTDKAWRRCPICYEAIYKDDLKSVVSVNKPAYKVGDEITMCLMRRGKDCVFPIPVACWKGRKFEKPFHLSDDKRITCFQKLLIATFDQVNEIVYREEAELKKQLSEEIETPEACFVETALQLLKQRKTTLGVAQEVVQVSRHLTKTSLEECSNTDEITSVMQSCDGFYTSEIEEKPQDTPFDIWQFDTQSLPDNNNAYADETHHGHLIRSVTDGNLGHMKIYPEAAEYCDLAEVSDRQIGKDSYYFFQAADGQQIYLHALNVKMLVREYGSLELCPPMFTARILEIEGESISENLRKRLGYLRHLPLTCEIQVVEVLLDLSILSTSTLEYFSGEVEKRQWNRTKRAKEERKRDRYIQYEEWKKRGKYPGARFNLNSTKHFPACDKANFINQPLETSDHPTSSITQSIPVETRPLSQEDASHSYSSADSIEETPSNPQRMSFAQMLRSGGMKLPKVVQKSKEDSSGNLQESDNEEYVPIPEYHQSFSSALQTALDNISKQDPPGDFSSGKKKKKSKKTLLFTTSMNRSK